MQNALQLPISTLASVLSGFFFVECNIFTGSAVISMVTVCGAALAERPVLFSPGSEVPQNSTFWMSPLFNTQNILIIWLNTIKSTPSLVVA